jgi:hypothetical protein
LWGGSPEPRRTYTSGLFCFQAVEQAVSDITVVPVQQKDVPIYGDWGRHNQKYVKTIPGRRQATSLFSEHSYP